MDSDQLACGEGVWSVLHCLYFELRCMPPLGVNRKTIGSKQKSVKCNQHCKGLTGSYIIVNLTAKVTGIISTNQNGSID